MNIVIDTNVFISALVKNSLTRSIIINSKNNLLFPEFELEEIKKHKLEIIKKSGLSEKEMNVLISKSPFSLFVGTLGCSEKSLISLTLRLLNYVKIIPTEIILPYKSKAKEIIGEIDYDDVIFVATALCFGACVWTDDKHFKKQNIITSLTTREMAMSEASRA